MPFVSTPNTYKAAINYTLNGQPVANILYVTTTIGLDDSEMETMAEDIFTLWAAQMMPPLSIQLSLDNVTLTDVSLAAGRQKVYIPVAPVLGEVGGEALPNNVAGVITLRTGFVGRSKRGRIFLPGLAEAAVANNVINGVVLAAIQAAIEGLPAVIEAASTGAYLAVVSFVQDHVALPNGEPTEVTSFQARAQVATQRRRMP